MYFDTERNDHGLPYNPFKGCLIPRPIGWISTRSLEGVNNLAPYSFFNGISSDPPMVAYGSNGLHADGGPKDTLRNIEQTGVFVVNVATWPLRDQMNASSHALASEVDEFVAAGLTAAPCQGIDAPRVAESPINLECRLHSITDLPCTEPGGRNTLVLGCVVGIHIDPSVLTDGQVDPTKVQPIARLGYRDYAVIRDVFSMARPGGGDALIGL